MDNTALDILVHREEMAELIAGLSRDGRDLLLVTLIMNGMDVNAGPPPLTPILLCQRRPLPIPPPWHSGTLARHPTHYSTLIRPARLGLRTIILHLSSLGPPPRPPA